MKLDSRGIAILKELEGRKLKAYQCSAGTWTICDGITEGVREGDTATDSECDERLANEIIKYEQAVLSGTGGDVNQNEFSAMTILAWNIGVSAFLGSTVLKAHNRHDKVAASRAFGLWNKVTIDGKKVVNKGLTRRRAIEAALYLEPEADEVVEPMPQVVAPPNTMTESTTMIAGGTAALATMTQIAEQIGKFKDGINGVGNWLIPSLLVITLVAVGWVIYERVQNRNRGSV